jgi:hypothetical protein
MLFVPQRFWNPFYPPIPQINMFELLKFGETYCDYLEDSWVISLELKSLGNMPVQIEKIYFTLYDEKTQVYDVTYVERIRNGDFLREEYLSMLYDEKTQVYDVTYVDYKGDIFREEDLSIRNPILIPDGEISLVQFTIPGTIYGDTVLILIQTRGGCNYIKGIQLSNTPFDLCASAEMVSKAYYLNMKIEFMHRWKAQYILLCIFIGFFVDGYLAHRQSDYFFKRNIEIRES